MMRHRKPLAKAATLAVGMLASYLLLGALAAFGYLLIWFDTVYIFTKGVRNIGIDLTTIVAIIYGIALGPVFGFLFAAVVMPAIVIVVMLAVFDFDMPIINVEFLYLGFTAGFSGLVAPLLPVFVTVLAAIAFRFGFSMVFSARLTDRPRMGYYLMNTLVSFMVIMAMSSAGLLRFIG